MTLHVLAAVLVIGPFVLIPFGGHQAIRRHDAAATSRSAKLTARFAIGTLLVAVLGFGALSESTRYTFRTPWVIISLTLWVIGMGVATGYTVPAMRRAAGIIEQGVLARPVAAADATDDAPEPNVAATATDLTVKERLDNISGRVIGSATLILVIFVLITVLMTWRPFGS